MRVALQLLGGFLVASLLSLCLSAVVLVQMPPDYFVRSEHGRSKHRLLRNVTGWLLVVAGLAMSVPGIPGQGLLTVLAGLILADFPRKMEIERRLIQRPAIRHAANAVRRWFGRPPFTLDAPGIH